MLPFVAGNGDFLSPFSGNGDFLSPFSATFVASVDRPLVGYEGDTPPHTFRLDAFGVSILAPRSCCQLPPSTQIPGYA